MKLKIKWLISSILGINLAYDPFLLSAPKKNRIQTKFLGETLNFFPVSLVNQNSKEFENCPFSELKHVHFCSIHAPSWPEYHFENLKFWKRNLIKSKQREEYYWKEIIFSPSCLVWISHRAFLWKYLSWTAELITENGIMWLNQWSLEK